jgi:hypothetical protein
MVQARLQIEICLAAPRFHGQGAQARWKWLTKLEAKELEPLSERIAEKCHASFATPFALLVRLGFFVYDDDG